MAEEETGFTFVDRRRTVPDTAEAPQEAMPPETAAPQEAMPPETAAPADVSAGDISAGDASAGDASAGDVSAGDVSAGDVSAGDADYEDTGRAPTTYDLLGYCINLLASQAWQKLGLLADPQTGEAQPDLAEAKIAIDAVGDLASRLDAAPDSAVPTDLRRDLKTLVNDLRLNYVSQRGPSA